MPFFTAFEADGSAPRTHAKEADKTLLSKHLLYFLHIRFFLRICDTCRLRYYLRANF